MLLYKYKQKKYYLGNKTLLKTHKQQLNLRQNK